MEKGLPEFKQHVPNDTHIEKITVAISRNDLKIMLSKRFANEGAIDKEFNELTDNYCFLFGFRDWLQTWYKL